MAKLFLGIRIPNRTYERIPIENVDFEETVSGLRGRIASKLDVSKEDIELLYCGSVLEDKEKLSEMNIKPNTTVHVLKRTLKPLNWCVGSVAFSDADCQRIADIFMDVTGTQINVQSRMNILQKILDEYPEFRRNLGAQALIRDSVLFNSLDKVDVIKKVAQNYPLICEAADFIVKTVKKEITKSYMEHAGTALGTEEFSDVTSGSEEETSAQSNSEQARIRRISRDQLAAALSQVGSSSSNSLSNIAQRHANSASSSENNASTSTSSPSATSSSPVRISSSLLNNALRNALLSANAPQVADTTRSISTGEENQSPTVQMDISENNQETTSQLNSAIQGNLFDRELQIMHEVGLTDDTINLQALILARGELEEAINFVYMWSS